jgi:hypothetical protein
MQQVEVKDEEAKDVEAKMLKRNHSALRSKSGVSLNPQSEFRNRDES